MKDYTHKCPNCLVTKNEINNFFCIKNTRFCEECLERGKHKKDFDPFYKFRPRNLSTVNKYSN